jgi:hypothetical protein
MAYLLDTNVFIQAKNLHYGLDFCPGFWDWLDDAHARGVVFSIERVRDELIDDDLGQWAASRGETFFLPPDAVALEGLRQTSQWANGAGYEPSAVNTFLQVADYYLVAHAHDHAVVTHEVPSNSTRKIKIPDACIGMGVRCVSPFTMLRTEGARFVLG